MNKQRSIPLWINQSLPIGRKIDANFHTEVCVIGAGIAGATTAYLLRREGKQVTLLDKDILGNGQTCRTTAHLSNAIDSRYYEIERIHGQEGARLTAESHSSAIDLIENICKAESIHCDFTRLDGFLYAPDSDAHHHLERELAACHAAGLTDVTLLDNFPLPYFKATACLRFPNQGQFHPVKYLTGLVNAFTQQGGNFYSHAEVIEVKEEEPIKIFIHSGHQITADAIVLATHTPILNRFVLHTKQAAYRTYVLGFRVPTYSVPMALYWDTLHPYHYIRLHRDKDADILIVGGKDHRTGQVEDERHCLEKLELWARARFPKAGPTLFEWSGQIEESLDGLAFIGHNPLHNKNVYVVTGDSGMGMTHGTIAGKLIRDLIAGRPNSWKELYDPGRKTLGSVKRWLQENMNTAIQYGDYFKSGKVKSSSELMRGQGAILNQGTHKVALYREENGTLHSLSAKCPHLGGIVKWNSEEKTWDCPCHGSRFSSTGSVINGPAACDLTPVPLKEEESHPETFKKAS